MYCFYEAESIQSHISVHFTDSYWLSIFGFCIWNLYDTNGVGFVITAMFAVIFLEQWLKEEHHITSMIGIVASVICLIIFGLNSFMIPTMAVIVITLTLSKRSIESLEVQK